MAKPPLSNLLRPAQIMGLLKAWPEPCSYTIHGDFTIVSSVGFSNARLSFLLSNAVTSAESLLTRYRLFYDKFEKLPAASCSNTHEIR